MYIIYIYIYIYCWRGSGRFLRMKPSVDFHFYRVITSSALWSVITCTICLRVCWMFELHNALVASVCARVTQYCELVLPNQQEHPCTGMIKHNQPTDSKNSTSRGHGTRFLCGASEATEIGWTRCWMQHFVPAAVHLDAWAHSWWPLKQHIFTKQHLFPQVQAPFKSEPQLWQWCSVYEILVSDLFLP